MQNPEVLLMFNGFSCTLEVQTKWLVFRMIHVKSSRSYHGAKFGRLGLSGCNYICMIYHPLDFPMDFPNPLDHWISSDSKAQSFPAVAAVTEKPQGKPLASERQRRKTRGSVPSLDFVGLSAVLGMFFWRNGFFLGKMM